MPQMPDVGLLQELMKRKLAGEPDKPWLPYELGNIDLYNRPHIKNPDGSVSTVRSMSFGEDGKEVLVPTAVGNSILSDPEAKKHYQQSGEFLGKFANPDEATRFAQRLHNEYARGKYGK